MGASSPIITFMVLAIISAALTINLLTLGIIGSLTAADCTEDYGYYCHDYYDYNYNCHYEPVCRNEADWAVVIGMESCLAVLGVIAGILCIWGSAVCCRAVCCCSSRNTASPAMYAISYPGQQMCVVTQQQQQPQQLGPTAPPPYCGAYPDGSYPMQFWPAASSVPPEGEPVMMSSAPVPNACDPNQVSLASTQKI